MTSPTEGPAGADSRTHWSLLLAGGTTADEGGRVAAYFYERYRRVVAAHLRRQGVRPGEAEDLVQEFFAVAFEKDFLRRADPARGRFRSFLRTAVEHFLADARRTAGRAKRRPERPLARLDRLEDGEWQAIDPASDDPTPERAFDRDWANQLVRRVLDELEASLRSRGREADYRAFAMRAFERRSSREIAEATGLPLARIDGICDRARRRFGERIRLEVAETVDPGDVDEEIRYLMSLFEG